MFWSLISKVDPIQYQGDAGIVHETVDAEIVVAPLNDIPVARRQHESVSNLFHRYKRPKSLAIWIKENCCLVTSTVGISDVGFCAAAVAKIGPSYEECFRRSNASDSEEASQVGDADEESVTVRFNGLDLDWSQTIAVSVSQTGQAGQKDDLTGCS